MWAGGSERAPACQDLAGLAWVLGPGLGLCGP